MVGNGRVEIRLAGAGGQGVVTAGRILAEAAVLSGRHATHSQVYGPESRGGACRSDVVIAGEAIEYPLTENIDVLVALSPEAYARYEPELAIDALLLVDNGAVPETAGRERARTAPIVEVARRVGGNPVVTGVVALGTLEACLDVIDPGYIERAIEVRVPSAYLDLNLRAFSAGLQLAGEVSVS